MLAILSNMVSRTQGRREADSALELLHVEGALTQLKSLTRDEEAFNCVETRRQVRLQGPRGDHNETYVFRNSRLRMPEDRLILFG